jgi:VanZ family protein
VSFHIRLAVRGPKRSSPVEHRKRNSAPCTLWDSPRQPAVVGCKSSGLQRLPHKKQQSSETNTPPGEHHERRRPYNDGGRGAGVDSDFIGPARLCDFRLFRNAAGAPHVQANIKALEPPFDRCSWHRSCAEPAAPTWLSPGIFGYLWLRAFWATFPNGTRIIWAGLAIACTFLIASLDEWHQSFSPARTGHFKDVVLDTCGALLLVSLAMVAIRRHRGRAHS